MSRPNRHLVPTAAATKRIDDGARETIVGVQGALDRTVDTLVKSYDSAGLIGRVCAMLDGGALRVRESFGGSEHGRWLRAAELSRKGVTKDATAARVTRDIRAGLWSRNTSAPLTSDPHASDARLTPACRYALERNVTGALVSLTMSTREASARDQQRAIRGIATADRLASEVSGARARLASIVADFTRAPSRATKRTLRAQAHTLCAQYGFSSPFAPSRDVAPSVTPVYGPHLDRAPSVASTVGHRESIAGHAPSMPRALPVPARSPATVAMRATLAAHPRTLTVRAPVKVTPETFAPRAQRAPDPSGMVDATGAYSPVSPCVTVYRAEVPQE